MREWSVGGGQWAVVSGQWTWTTLVGLEGSMMSEQSESGQAVVFRAAMGLYIIVGVLMGFFIVLGLLIAIKKPSEWLFLAGTCAVTIILLALISYLRLEIGHEGIHYRNLSNNRLLKYSDIKRAYFEVVKTHKAPQGVAVFWIEPNDGRRMKVNLRTFPTAAAAVLFTELERRSIPIDVPDLWAARNMVDQIRKCQEKLMKRVP
jgi:hypothetical protein